MAWFVSLLHSTTTLPNLCLCIRLLPIHTGFLAVFCCFVLLVAIGIYQGNQAANARREADEEEAAAFARALMTPSERNVMAGVDMDKIQK